MGVMRAWKARIRTALIKVRAEFNDWVDTFTNQFAKSLKGVEGTQRELADLGGFLIDATLKRMLEELRESYVKIMLIFNEVTNKPIHEKLSTIEETRKTILDIEDSVKRQDLSLRELHDKVLAA
jgi:hypothetical protein